MDYIKNLVPKRDHSIVFRHQLSWYLVPLLIFIWFIIPQSHPVFANSMISILVIGIIETIFFTPVSIISKTISVILHLLILIPLFYNKIFTNINKNPEKSCLQQNNSERKGEKYIKDKKKVKFSNKNLEYYKNDFRYLVMFNTWNFIILIAGILIINFLPYWPYFMTRRLMSIILILTTIFLWIYAYYF